MKSPYLLLILCSFGILSVPVRFLIKEPREINIPYSEIKNEGLPPCIQLYSSIEKHSKKYGIPLKYALGIAHVESSYNGPLHWGYKHDVVSPAGALGPMQIMPTTADMMWDTEKIPREKILKDIDFNVETSMKLLSKLYKKYKDWKIVFGCYNTGKPCINSYSEKVYNFKPKNSII